MTTVLPKDSIYILVSLAVLTLLSVVVKTRKHNKLAKFLCFLCGVLVLVLYTIGLFYTVDEYIIVLDLLNLSPFLVLFSKVFINLSGFVLGCILCVFVKKADQSQIFYIIGFSVFLLLVVSALLLRCETFLA